MSRKKTQEEVDVALDEQVAEAEDDIGAEFESVYDPNEDTLADAGNLFDLDDDF